MSSHRKSFWQHLTNQFRQQSVPSRSAPHVGPKFEPLESRENPAIEALPEPATVFALMQNQYQSQDVAMFGDGTSVIATALNGDVHIEINRPDGTYLENKSIENTPLVASNVAISANRFGDYVVTYTAENGLTGDKDIRYYFRSDRFNVTLSGQANTTDLDRIQDDSSVALRDNGVFIVAWEDHFAGGDENLRYRFLDGFSNVNLGDDVHVLGATDLVSEVDPSVAVGGNNRAVITWTDGNEETEIRMTILSPDGVYSDLLAADSTTLDLDSSVAMDKQGNVIVAYRQWFVDTNESAIRTRRFNAVGGVLSNTVLVDYENSARSLANPDVAFDEQSNYAVSWLDYELDIEGDVVDSDVRLLYRNFQDQTVSGTYQVNVNNIDNVLAPALATSGKNFVVSYELRNGANTAILDRLYGQPLGSQELGPGVLGLADDGGIWLGQSFNGGKAGFDNRLVGVFSDAVNWSTPVTGNFRPELGVQNGIDEFLARDPGTGTWWMLDPDGPVVQNWTNWSPLVTWNDVLVGDFDGDGFHDLAGRVSTSGQWWVTTSDGDVPTTGRWTTWATQNTTWVNVMVGDVNGDGRDDIVGRAAESGQWWVARSTGNGFVNELWTTWSTAVTWADVKIGDFNGDNRADLIGRVNSTGEWWSANSTGLGFLNFSVGVWSPNVTWVDVQFADMNGDGRADLMGRVAQDGSWWAGISTGNSLQTNYAGAWNPSVDMSHVMVADVNRDGRADIVGRNSANGQWWASMSVGTTFKNHQWGNFATLVNWDSISAAAIA